MKTLFFIPKKKIDFGTQTNLINNKKINFIKKVEEESEKYFFETNLIKSKLFSNVDCEKFKSNLIYFQSDINDSFDKFAINSNFLTSKQISFKIELNKSNFIIINNENQKNISYNYDPEPLKILLSIENNEINIQLFIILNHLNFNKWKNGSIICQIKDNRIEPILINEFNLNINPLNILIFQNKYNFELEKKILLNLYPQICIDPSPNVSRFNSLIDWKKKQWINNNNNFEIFDEKIENIKNNLPNLNFENNSIKNLKSIENLSNDFLKKLSLK